jgi:small subunit ribosomal protein S20
VATKDGAAALEALKAAIPVIDKAATKGVIHRSNAARNVSRLTKLVNTVA